MTPFQQAMLLQLQAEIEALVSERQGMVAANAWRASCGDPPLYNEDAFLANANALRHVIDPHHFE